MQTELLLLTLLLFVTACRGQHHQPNEENAAVKSTPLQRALRSRRDVPDDVAVRFIVYLLKNKDLDKAAVEIEKLENRLDLVKEIVKKALNESVKISDLAAFTTRTGYFAMKALVEEIEKNGNSQDNEIAILIIYLKLQQGILKLNHAELEDLSTEMRQLLDKLSDRAKATMGVLVDGISKGNFLKTYDQLAKTKKAMLNGIFLTSIVTQYLAKTDTSFSQLFKFLQHLKYKNETCYGLSVAFENLRDNGKGDGFEALQLWLLATERKENYAYDNILEQAGQKCKTVAESAAPAHKEIMMQLYNNNLRNKNFDELIEWHKNYSRGMRVLLQEIVAGYTKEQMQNLESPTLTNLLDLMEELPTYEDNCWVAEATNQKLASFGMFNTTQHFRVQRLIDETVTKSVFQRLHGLDKEKCMNALRIKQRLEYVSDM